MTQRSTGAVLDDLDAQIAARSILQHPFYRAWSAGTLRRQDLAAYARLYYPHVAAFPGYLEAAANGADLAPVRAELQENLREERTEPLPHAELWLRFAAAVGAEPALVRAAEPAPAVQESVAEFRRLCAGSTAGALGALYAYESQQPEVSALKAAGLRDLYGVTDAEALSYFSVHAEADLRHRAGERRAIGLCVEAGAASEEVQSGAAGALAAYWRLLDAVTAECGAAPAPAE
ncbi:MAG TPA: iron-containing redox enzyme family protein [Thermoanaerobaculia bacterium]|nr:iron-containing redox enzyme family protein [Thermoanaerobaculia bacterium]